MKKRKSGRKLSRKTGPRRALLRALARNLFLKEKIMTSEAKAKEASIFVEKTITLAKRNGLAARRRLARKFSPEVVKKVVEEIVPRYEKRKGGYVRIIKLAPRKSDGAKMAIIELVK